MKKYILEDIISGQIGIGSYNKCLRFNTYKDNRKKVKALSFNLRHLLVLTESDEFSVGFQLNIYQ